jgi:hypothetical protein
MKRTRHFGKQDKDEQQLIKRVPFIIAFAYIFWEGFQYILDEDQIEKVTLATVFFLNEKKAPKKATFFFCLSPFWEENFFVEFVFAPHFSLFVFNFLFFFF